MNRLIIAVLMAAIGLGSLTAGIPVEEYYVKQVDFPDGATVETKVDMASRLVPTQQQLDWQRLGLTAFLHFGMNTFTNREWGDGKEDPATFNPSALDVDQWVKTLRDAGFGMVILTAKHHDGFCLWPTATTEHSVKSSPWMDGQGDVVKSLRQACDKYGMKMGVYLSPWDRNAPQYGDSPAYNDLFARQLTELLTNYGRVDEVWFDGACAEGPNGKRQEYDWARFKAVMQKLQPTAVLAIMGDDIRWVGNEGGQGRPTEWSAVALTPGYFPGADQANARIGLEAMSKDLGGRDVLEKAKTLYWWPSEVDVSIRPGWFYHPNESPKSLRDLAQIYLNSVGRNATLLLNIPPDTRGRLATADSARLMQLARWIRNNFSEERNLVDVAGQLAKPAMVNCVELAEDITRGQRVEAFDVEVLNPASGNWEPVDTGTTIGYKRILTFPDVNAKAVRTRVTQSRGMANLLPLKAYRIEMPEPETLIDTLELLSAARVGGDAFTLDLGEVRDVNGVIYTPPTDGRGTVFRYALMLSDNGKDWRASEVPGEMSNIQNNPIAQRVKLMGAPLKTRYIRLMPVSTIDQELPAGTLRVF